MKRGTPPPARGSIPAEIFGVSGSAGYAHGALKSGKVSVVKRSRPSTRTLAAAFVVLAAVLGGAVVVGPAGADSIADKRAEAAQIGAKLDQLQSRAQELNGQYESARYELRAAQERVNAAKVLAAQTSAEAEERRGDLRRYAIAAYQTGNDSPEFDALITNDSSTGVQKRSYLQSISGSRQDLVDALNAARQKAEEDGVRLKVAEDATSAKAAEIEQLKKAADDAANEQAAVNARVQGELKVLVDAENARIAAARAAEANARAAASRGSGSSAAPNPNPGSIRGEVSRAIAAGMTKLGAGYVWAAEGPDVFDCSGFVRWAFLQVGISLPHYSGAMYQSTIRISESQLQPGDLVFWGVNGSQHVAIYIGGNQILHTARGVAVTPMNGWWTYGPIMTFGRIP